MSKQSAIKASPKSNPSVMGWAGLAEANTLLLVILLGLVLSAGLSVVQATHDNRFAFNQLQELKDEANSLDVEWGQLLLEQSTFGVDGKIEAKAVEQLQMKVPAIESIVMVKK